MMPSPTSSLGPSTLTPKARTAASESTKAGSATAEFATAGLAIALLAIAFVAAACVPTETGNPPIALDVTGVAGAVQQNLVQTQVSLEGAPQSVSPPEGLVVAMLLEDTTSVASTPVLSDGSFETLLVSGDGARVRLWVEGADGESVSPPVDWQIAEALLRPAARDVDPCVIIERTFQTSFDDARTAITNECGGPLQLSVVEDMLGSPATVDSTIPDGGTGAVVFSAPGMAAWVAQIAITGAATGTVYVSGRAR